MESLFIIITGIENYLCGIDYRLLVYIENTMCQQPHIVSPTFTNVADDIRNYFDIQPPTTFTESLELYFLLVEILNYSL